MKDKQQFVNKDIPEEQHNKIEDDWNDFLGIKAKKR